jgi:hypothetical protein
LGVARPIGSEEYWYVISDEAAELKMFAEYGLRWLFAKSEASV